MSATKTITLACGGTITLTTSGIQFFEANEEEKKLLDDIAKACKEYERKAERKKEQGEPREELPPRQPDREFR